MSASVTAGTKSTVSSEPVLEISNLYAGYARRSILKDLSLTLERGEFVGLIGANGAGKTTLLRTILGLIRPASGQVRVLGESPRAARVHIGYVPQKHQFQWDFPLTVKDTVMTGRVREIGFFRRPAKKDWVQVFSAMERTDVLHLQDASIAELSGGQRQRVLLARALAAGPSLLLLDEPFTGVDAPTQTTLTRLYRELADEGITILMSTHDMLAARESCSRLCGVRGNIHLDGPAASFSLEQLHTWLHGHDIEEAQGHARTGFTCAGGALDEYGHELPDSCASSPAHADTATSTGGSR